MFNKDINNQLGGVYQANIAVNKVGADNVIALETKVVDQKVDIVTKTELIEVKSGTSFMKMADKSWGWEDFTKQANRYTEAAKKEGKTAKYIFENEPSQAVRNYLDSICIKDVEVVKNV